MRGSKMQRFLLFVFITVFVFSASILGWRHARSLREEDTLKQLAQTKQSTESTKRPTWASPDIVPQALEEAPSPAILEQYYEVSQQNENMVGWVKIDDTEVDYPVMYTGDDFYLNHDFDKADAKSGLPYIDKCCTVEPFGTNIIIYSHNMKNKTMFSSLPNYKYWIITKSIPVFVLTHCMKHRNMKLLLRLKARSTERATRYLNTITS